MNITSNNGVERDLGGRHEVKSLFLTVRYTIYKQ